MDEFERIIRPIVEGQIRGFLKEHPKIVDAVDWYKPRKHDKATTFVNSLAKRLVRDICCAHSRARIKAALLEALAENAVDASGTATGGEQAGRSAGLL